MFRYNVRGENIEAARATRDYIEKRAGKLEKYFSDSLEAAVHVNLKMYTKETAKVEVTIPLPYLVLQAEEVSPDLYASTNSVVDKLERQIRKLKTEVNRKSHKTGHSSTKAVVFLVGGETEETPLELNIVRTKRLSLKSMDNEEAVLQMNMLGHNFFIFEGTETDGTGIVCRRKDGEYGLIEAD